MERLKLEKIRAAQYY
jgi:hypothetical protein